MPRFDRLELEPTPQEPDSPGRGQPERDERYWLKLAEASRRMGLYESALRYYSRALEVDKSLTGAWLGQVCMLIALEEYPEAELWSRKALEIFKGNGDLMAGRAQALCRSGDRKQAHALCDGALRLEGQSAYRWMVRGELMASGREEIDRHCFDKAIQLDPDWLVPLEIALIYLHYGNATKALARAHEAVGKAADSPYCWYVQGVCQTELDLESQAERSFERCRELAPNHTEAGQRLAELRNRGWSFGRSLRRLFGLS